MTSPCADYWLFTNEPVTPDASSRENITADVLPVAADLSVTVPQQVKGQLCHVPQQEPTVVVVNAHSGLWRTCIIIPESEREEGFPVKICSSIAYFEQSSERFENADTTMSILRAIRKSSPVIVGSLLLLLTAVTLSIVGTTKNDFKIIISAIIYIFSALSLGMGVILYISAVNDEVAHRKKQPDSGSDSRNAFTYQYQVPRSTSYHYSTTILFTYQYGWAFFFGGATFVCAMAAAVSNISLYLRRYSHLDDTMLITPAATAATTALSRSAEGALTGTINGPITTGYRPVRRVDMDCTNGHKPNSWYDGKPVTAPADRPIHSANHNLTIPL